MRGNAGASADADAGAGADVGVDAGNPWARAGGGAAAAARDATLAALSGVLAAAAPQRSAHAAASDMAPSTRDSTPALLFTWLGLERDARAVRHAVELLDHQLAARDLVDEQHVRVKLNVVASVVHALRTLCARAKLLRANMLASPATASAPVELPNQRDAALLMHEAGEAVTALRVRLDAIAWGKAVSAGEPRTWLARVDDFEQLVSTAHACAATLAALQASSTESTPGSDARR